MSRWRVLLASAGLLVTVVAVATSLYAGVVNALSVPVTVESVVWTLGYVAFGAVGAIVAVKRPEHPIGWMFLGIGVCGGLAEAADGVASLRLADDDGIGAAAGWISTWVWAPSLGLVVWSITLFPTGRPLGRLTGLLGRGAFGLTLAMAAVNAIDIWPIRSADVALMMQAPDRFSSGFMAVAFPVFMLSAVAAMVSVIVRYRRSHGVERQQMKWLAALAAVAAPCIVATQTLVEDGPLHAVLNTLSAPAWLAVAVGIAVTRYRLYEIDRLISRTLAYAGITAILVGVYAAGVLGIGAVVRTVSGESGDLVVALSTLIVAALFAPVRKRVQQVVDLRFNRARTDATKLVADFGSRLRNEVDLGSLRGDVEAVTRRVVEPSAVGLWLPQPGTGR